MLKGLTDEKIKRYEAAVSLQMFLLHELGPTKFVFKVGEAEEGIKVKISLTNVLECSCGAGTSGNSRCSHALFALIKVFKVPNTSELLWQDKYSEQQINSILEGRFRKQKAVLEAVPKREYLKRKKDLPPDGKASKPEKPTKQLDPDDSCPICYDSLGKTQSHTTCKSCQNYFHSKCLLTWSRHHSTSNPTSPIKCPMCRAEWGPSPYLTVREIENDIEEFSKREMFHPGSVCAGCNKKGIVGAIYQNIWNPMGTCMCQTCFELKFLNKPYEIITKTKPRDPWLPHNCPGTIPFEVFLVFSLKTKQDITRDSSATSALVLQVVGKDVSNTLCMCCKQTFSPDNTLNKGHSVLKLPCDHRICSICLIKRWGNAFKVAREGYEAIRSQIQPSESNSEITIKLKLPNPPLPRCTCPLDNMDVFPAFVPAPALTKKLNTLVTSLMPAQQTSSIPQIAPQPMMISSKGTLPPLARPWNQIKQTKPQHQTRL